MGATMKRDMDLVRDILFALGKGTDLYLKPEGLDVQGFATEEVRSHLILLGDAGFVSSFPMPSTNLNGLKSFAKGRIGTYRLTWQGHEFLDTVRDPEIWRKTKAGAAKVGGLGVEVLWGLAKEYVKAEVRDRLGVPLSRSP